jgi:hypothetical protein
MITLSTVVVVLCLLYAPWRVLPVCFQYDLVSQLRVGSTGYIFRSDLSLQMMMMKPAPGADLQVDPLPQILAAVITFTILSPRA